LLPRALLLLCFLAVTPLAHPQGCTQCRDNTASTSPATQRAYRKAIYLLTSVAAGIFTATLIFARRQP
jgi:hypothetical protein